MWRCGGDTLPPLLGVWLGAVTKSTKPCQNPQTPTSPRDDHHSTSKCSLSHTMTYGYVYIAASSKKISAYHTTFKLHRRAFDISTNRQKNLHPNSPGYRASQRHSN